MRKIALLLSILLGLFACFSGVYAEQATEAVEQKSFDFTVYENAENYSYDKFEKTWDIYAAYSKKYSDARVVFGLKVWGDTKSVRTPPYIYVWIREANNRDVKFKISGLQIIANDTVFSAKSIIIDESDSYMYLDSITGKALLNAIIEGDELAFKMLYSTGSLVEEITGYDYLSIKHLAQLIVDNDAWAYVLDSDGNDLTVYDKWIEKNYPIEIIE